MKHRMWMVLLFAAVLAAAASLPAHLAYARSNENSSERSRAARENSVVKIDLPQELHVGAENTVIVTLTTASGRPITDQTVKMKVNGENDRRGRTSFNGTTSLLINQTLVSGQISIEIDFEGSSQYNPSRNSVNAEVLPGILEIPVVPALPGVKLSLDGNVAVSDENGIVRFPLSKEGTYRISFPRQDENPKYTIGFYRWSDEMFTQERLIDFPLRRLLQLGLDISYSVKLDFYDENGKPVSMDRITSYTIKGSHGTPYTFTDGGPHWLPAARVTRRATGLEETRILYSVLDVQVDGSNVVIQAQQRMYLEPNTLWKVNLLFYSAEFSTRDALFGFPLGQGIELHYPDGRIEIIPFQQNKQIVIDSLARGLYQVRVHKAPGLSPLTPIALSKNQVVSLMVLSYFDVMVIIILGGVVAFGLILIGRPGILRLLKRTRKAKNIQSGRPVVVPQVESRRIRKDGTL